VEQPEPNITAGRRLLIVDDDSDLRMLLAGYFRRIGYEVEEKESGIAAIEPATAGNFDCFIFDVSMPGMTGFDLLRKVRDRGVRTPAMFLTAHDSIDDKLAGFQAGADDYLGKPFNPRELEVRVEALLRRSIGAQQVSDGERSGDRQTPPRSFARRRPRGFDSARISNSRTSRLGARKGVVQKRPAGSGVEY
jgi:DNA-binding response OmpR family regulator